MKVYSIFGLYLICVYFGISLCVAETSVLSGKSCDHGMYCALPELCVDESLIDIRSNVCTRFERCCVVKGNLTAVQTSRSICAGAGNYCVPVSKCINGLIDDTIGFIYPKQQCSWNEVCCSSSEQALRPNKPLASHSCGQSNPLGLDHKSDNAGKGYAKFGEFPWMVQVYEILYPHGRAINETLCVGSLVAPHIVLTIAYQIAESVETNLYVRAGEWDTRTMSERYPHEDSNVRKMFIHRDFHNRSMYYDIAMLILKDRFELRPHIGPICLPQADKNFDNSRCLLAGWGRRNDGDWSNTSILKKFHVPIVDRSTCQDRLRSFLQFPYFELHSSFICAGGAGENIYNGHGGAALMCPIEGSHHRYELAGVLSFRFRDAGNDVPSVYVSVAMLRSWITEIQESNKY